MTYDMYRNQGGIKLLSLAAAVELLPLRLLLSLEGLNKLGLNCLCSIVILLFIVIIYLHITNAL